MNTQQKWTADETETLIRLLEKVKADGGWWPSEACMRAAHGAMSAWAPEIVITKPYGILGRIQWIIGWTCGALIGLHPISKILLTTYDGGIEEFRGKWHIPGGYGTIADESVYDACSRIAKKEIGVDVRYIKAVPHPHLWRPGEHPYGRPLSLYSWVRPKQEIVETPSRRFFGPNELPKNILEVHRTFIKQEIFPIMN